MATIKKSLPHENYTKIDNKVIIDNRLTEGARLLYCYYASLPNGQRIADEYILMALDMKQATLTRRKKELKDVGLIYIERHAAKDYTLYVGYSNKSADEVKKYWDNR